MKTWIDFDQAPIFAIPSADGPGMCEGMLIEGPQGWGEFSPPRELDDRRAARWLTAAVEVGTVGWPDPLRGRVPVAVAVPAVSPDRARQIVAASGCRAAAVAVGSGVPAADLARVEAVRDALGPAGAIRCDANGAWDAETAVAAVTALNRAAGGLEFIEQPCRTIAETTRARTRLDVPVAVDKFIRDAEDPLETYLAEAADIAVLTAGPLGGVRRALRVAERCGLPCVVSGALESSIGTAGGLALAGALPEAGFAHELGTAALLAGDVVSAGRSLVPVDGWLPVAPMPPAPDPERIERFAVTDHRRVRWWRDRLAAVQRYV